MPIPFGSQFDVGGKASAVITLSIPGTLVAALGTIRFPLWRNITILNVVAQLGTAPTGAAAIFDVSLSGTTIFTTQANRPTVAAGALQDLTSVPDVTTAPAGGYLTVDVDQVGSTVAGADAVIVIEYQ